MLPLPYKMAIYNRFYFLVTSKFWFFTTWSFWFRLWFSLPFLIASYLCRWKLTRYILLRRIHMTHIISLLSYFMVVFHFYFCIFLYFWGWFLFEIFIALFSGFFLSNCFVYVETLRYGLFFLMFVFLSLIGLVNYFTLGDVHDLVFTFSISFSAFIITWLMLLKISRTRSHFLLPLFTLSNCVITHLFPLEWFIHFFRIIIKKRFSLLVVFSETLEKAWFFTFIFYKV